MAYILKVRFFISNKWHKLLGFGPTNAEFCQPKHSTRTSQTISFRTGQQSQDWATISCMTGNQLQVWLSDWTTAIRLTRMQDCQPARRMTIGLGNSHVHRTGQQSCSTDNQMQDRQPVAGMAIGLDNHHRTDRHNAGLAMSRRTAYRHISVVVFDYF